MVGYGGSSAGLYLADPTSSIPSHCASIVVTSTVRVKYSTCISINSLFTRQVESRQFPVSIHFNKVTHDDYIGEAFKKVRNFILVYSLHQSICFVCSGEVDNSDLFCTCVSVILPPVLLSFNISNNFRTCL